MAFKVHKGKVVRRWMPVTPSTAIAGGSIVQFSSGKLIAATNSSTGVAHVGVLEKTIAATDSDYASDRLVAVIVPVEKGVLWEGTTASLVAGDLGAEVDLTDAATVNRGASSVDVAVVKGVISSTKGIFNLKIDGAY